MRKKCNKCGGWYQEHGISAGMYNPSSVPQYPCRCGTQRRTPPFRGVSSHSTQPQNSSMGYPQKSSAAPRVTFSVSPEALWRQAEQARSSVQMPPAFYITLTVGVIVTALSILVAAMSDEDGGWWIAGVFLGLVITCVALIFQHFVREDAMKLRMQQLARDASSQITQVHQTQKQEGIAVVPLAQRPTAPCRNCGSNVIAGSPKCHRCGFSDFQWECTSCGGPFVMTDIGLLYCNRCQGYWK